MASLNSALSDGNEGESLEFEKEFYEALVYGTKASNAFSSDAEEYEYLSTKPEFRERVDDFKNRITGLLEQFAVQIGGGQGTFDLDALKTADPSDPDAFEPISDIVDLLLENTDSYVDQAKGGELKKSNTEAVVASHDLVRRVKAGMHGVITHANIMRPQLKFTEPVNNERPKLGNYTDIVAGTVEEHARSLGKEITSTSTTSVNLFQKEIEDAFINSPKWIFEEGKGDLPTVLPLDQTPLQWIETRNELEVLCNRLKKENVIAVDLENHSYRSYQGFLCLMQISTHDQDYLVDTIALRSDLHIMNDIFTDSSILKVMHGADSDVQWLQRDFGIFITSLFDTGQAARLLQYPSAGLAYSLKFHCNVSANKAYQLADWRLRPLPEAMVKYAREDTHYLLKVFEIMRRELMKHGDSEHEMNLVKEVLRRSRDIALTVYTPPAYSPDTYKKIVKRRNLRLSAAQLRVLAAVHEWVDRIARIEDESEEYVLPSRLLVRIAQAMPTTNIALEGVANPMPPVVRVHQTEVLSIIRDAKESTFEASQLAYNNAIAAAGGNKEVMKETTKPVATPAKKNSHSNDDVAMGNQHTVTSANTASSQVSAIGVNSARTTFVPITDAEAMKWNTPRPRSRMDTLQNEEAVRATPSPVLTTEQLYDTAGWQDIVEPPKQPSSKVMAVKATKETIDLKSPSNSMPSGLSRAIAMRERIGQEHLSNAGQGFSASNANTPFATMATAMAAKASESKTQLTNQSMLPQDAEQSVPLISSESSAVEGVEMMVKQSVDALADSPADTDALESDNIPKSMAEIYRISNRNRKRNKEKKKVKGDDASTTGNEAANSLLASTPYAATAPATNNKRAKNNNSEQQSDNNADDDAVSFMANIGWVDPNEAAKGGANSVRRVDSQSGNRNSSAQSSRRSHKPKSPRKGRTGVPRSQGGFEYSAAAVTAAGVVPSRSATGNSRSGRSRGGRGGQTGNRRVPSANSYSRAVASQKGKKQ